MKLRAEVESFIDSVVVGSADPVALSAVVTLYNEEDNIEPLTRELVSAFRRRFPGERFELVLVLNGPLDRTRDIAQPLAGEFPEVTLVDIKTNRGYGGGVQAGLLVARAPLVGFLCGDRQVCPEDVAEAFAVAREGDYDMVKVVRTARADGLVRVIVSGVYNWLFRARFGIKAEDINATPKVFKRAALERLRLTCLDWFLDAEIMIQAARSGLSVGEIPVRFQRRRQGRSHVRFGTVVEFLRNIWGYRYDQS